MSGLPSITAYLIGSMAFVNIYLVKKKKIYLKSTCPYFTPLLLLSISRFLTCTTSVTGFSDEFSRAIGYLFYSVLQVLLIWKVLNKEEDFYFIFKGYIVIFFISGIYGIVEYITRQNPFFQYKSLLTPEGLTAYRVDAFRGYRLMSIFEHPIGAGINFSLFLILIYLLGFSSKKSLPYKGLSKVAEIMSIICVFLTKMRSGLMFLFIGILGALNFKKKRTYIIVTLVLVFALAIVPLFSDKFLVFLSFFDKTAQSRVGGSSFTQRMMQLKAVFELNQRSPYFGLGTRFMEKVSLSMQSQILGLESIWFEELTKYGWVGVICTIIMIIYSVIYIPYKYKCREVFFISLAYWLTYTFTSLPFVRMSMYYVICFYCIKFKSQIANK